MPHVPSGTAAAAAIEAHRRGLSRNTRDFKFEKRWQQFIPEDVPTIMHYEADPQPTREQLDMEEVEAIMGSLQSKFALARARRYQEPKDSLSAIHDTEPPSEALQRLLIQAFDGGSASASDSKKPLFDDTPSTHSKGNTYPLNFSLPVSKPCLLGFKLQSTCSNMNESRSSVPIKHDIKNPIYRPISTMEAPLGCSDTTPRTDTATHEERMKPSPKSPNHAISTFKLSETTNMKRLSTEMDIDEESETKRRNPRTEMPRLNEPWPLQTEQKVEPETADDAIDDTDGDAAEAQWQLSDVPPELKLATGIPQLDAMIEEFWQHCQAIQASARTLQEDVQRQLEQSKNTQAHGGGPNDESSTSHTKNCQGALQVHHGHFDARNREHKAEELHGINSLARHSAHLMSKIWKGKQPARPGTVEAVTAKECTSCFDELRPSDSIDLPCHHSYCRMCLEHLISTAMQNENQWPPKCCLTEIPRKLIMLHLPEKLIVEFGAKEKEYNKAANERWYCTNPKCLKYFEATKHSNWTACMHCKYQMCLHCRGKRHSEQERCPQDRDLQATLMEAELSGWKTCSRCSHMIERNEGCRHITCKCGYEFCYACGRRWGSCRCTEADITRQHADLTARREAQRIQREAEQAEEAAVQAAIEAVAKQQRKEEEKQLLEEKRMWERMEAERVKNIKNFYEMFLRCMNEVHQQQLQYIKTRQESTFATYEHQITDARERLERTKQMASISPAQKLRHEYEERVIQCLLDQQQVRQVLVAGVKRCNRPESRSGNVERIKEVLDMQETERKDLDKRFEEKMAALNHQSTPEPNLTQELTKETIALEIAELTRSMEAAKHGFTLEQKWVDLAATERPKLVNEDQTRLLQSGTDAPALSTLEKTIRLRSYGSAKDNSKTKPAASPHFPLSLPPLPLGHSGSALVDMLSAEKSHHHYQKDAYDHLSHDVSQIPHFPHIGSFLKNHSRSGTNLSPINPPNSKLSPISPAAESSQMGSERNRHNRSPSVEVLGENLNISSNAIPKSTPNVEVTTAGRGKRFSFELNRGEASEQSRESYFQNLHGGGWGADGAEENRGGSPSRSPSGSGSGNGHGRKSWWKRGWDATFVMP